MKLLLIFLTILLSNEVEQQETRIYGRWQLIKIEVNQEILRPEKGSYFLTIDENSISYNLEINDCKAVGFTINDNRIEFNGVMCTEICCDGRYDSISNFINYQGLYKLNQNQLIINTDNSKLFLDRALNQSKIPSKL